MAIFNSYFDITRGYRNHISLAYPFLLRKDRIFGCRSPMVFCLPGPSLRWFSLKKHVFLWLKMKVNQPKNKKSHHQNLGGPSFLSYTPFQPFNDVVICCVSAPFFGPGLSCLRPSTSKHLRWSCGIYIRGVRNFFPPWEDPGVPPGGMPKPRCGDFGPRPWRFGDEANVPCSPSTNESIKDTSKISLNKCRCKNV